mmetsp:Transcript_24399/g.39254  ORF Transcript_24399/g.39254 Transcript_24399/m.39254 type:complete len:318 (+) Transcript_24399:56-1009(+)
MRGCLREMRGPRSGRLHRRWASFGRDFYVSDQFGNAEVALAVLGENVQTRPCALGREAHIPAHPLRTELHISPEVFERGVSHLGLLLHRLRMQLQHPPRLLRKRLERHGRCIKYRRGKNLANAKDATSLHPRHACLHLAFLPRTIDPHRAAILCPYLPKLPSAPCRGIDWISVFPVCAHQHLVADAVRVITHLDGLHAGIRRVSEPGQSRHHVLDTRVLEIVELFLKERIVPRGYVHVPDVVLGGGGGVGTGGLRRGDACLYTAYENQGEGERKCYSVRCPPLPVVGVARGRWRGGSNARGRGRWRGRGRRREPCLR